MSWMDWYNDLAIGTMIVVWPHYRWVAVAQVPYLIWMSLATVLQLSITWMNWGRP